MDMKTELKVRRLASSHHPLVQALAEHQLRIATDSRIQAMDRAVERECAIEALPWAVIALLISTAICFTMYQFVPIFPASVQIGAPLLVVVLFWTHLYDITLIWRYDSQGNRRHR